MNRTSCRSGARNPCRRDVLKSLFLLPVMLACMLLAGPAALAAGTQSVPFDHMSTGFELDGAHKDADCSGCHARGVFKGTPRQCSICHGTGSTMAAEVMSPNHIRTTSRCQECHSTSQWKPVVRMNHDMVIGSCVSCHDGRKAAGKTPGHIASGNNCENCHNTSTFTMARFDHSNVTGTCFSCHDGRTATGKSPTHVSSGNACGDCHSTTAWRPAGMLRTSIPPAPARTVIPPARGRRSRAWIMPT